MKLSKIYAKIYNILTQKPCLGVLKKNGLTVGKNINLQNGSIIDTDHCWLIRIGDDVTLAPNAHILAHDASTKKFIGYTKIGKVTIGNKVFIGAGSIILPNVTIGDNVIIGANSVVCKNVPSNTIVAGNPATIINTLENYLNKYKNVSENLRFGKEYTVLGKITKEKRNKMNIEIQNEIGLVE